MILVIISIDITQEYYDILSLYIGQAPFGIVTQELFENVVFVIAASHRQIAPSFLIILAVPNEHG